MPLILDENHPQQPEQNSMARFDTLDRPSLEQTIQYLVASAVSYEGMYEKLIRDMSEMQEYINKLNLSKATNDRVKELENQVEVQKKQIEDLQGNISQLRYEKGFGEWHGL